MVSISIFEKDCFFIYLRSRTKFGRLCLFDITWSYILAAISTLKNRFSEIVVKM